MFDAKSLIEMLARGAAPSQPQPGAQGGLGDLLGGLMGGGQSGGGLADILGKLQQGAGQQGGGGLGDLLRNLAPGQGGQAAPTGGQGGGLGGLDDLIRNIAPGAGGQGAGGAGAGGIGDILGKLQQQGGGLGDLLGQVLGQATSGVKEGAQRIDDATGAGRSAGDAIRQATGKSPEELIALLKELIASNQLGAGAALGGLGALVLGTRTGRSLAANAAKLGALALIGGLAYKAYQNYAQGRPASGGDRGFVPEAAPRGSGFEPDAITNEQATLYIRAMIAAAASDGRIDQNEQQKILGGLKQAGIERAAEEFLANELNNPASAADLAAAVRSPEEAAQVFTAARVAIDLDSEEEHAFLVDLAGRLGLEPALAQHIDSAARAAAA